MARLHIVWVGNLMGHRFKFGKRDFLHYGSQSRRPFAPARESVVALAASIDRSRKPIQPKVFADAVAGVVYAIERGDRNGKPVTNFAGALITAYRDLVNQAAYPSFHPPNPGAMFADWVSAYRRGVLPLGQIDPRRPEPSAEDDLRMREAAEAKRRAEWAARDAQVLASEHDRQWRDAIVAIAPLSDRDVIEWLRIKQASEAAVGNVKKWLRLGRPSETGQKFVLPHISDLTPQSLGDAQAAAVLREQLFEALRVIATDAASVAVGKHGDHSSFEARKAMENTVFCRLHDPNSTKRIRQSLVRLRQIADEVGEGKASYLRMLTREELEALLEAVSDVIPYREAV